MIRLAPPLEMGYGSYAWKPTRTTSSTSVTIVPKAFAQVVAAMPDIRVIQA